MSPVNRYKHGMKYLWVKNLRLPLEVRSLEVPPFELEPLEFEPLEPEPLELEPLELLETKQSDYLLYNVHAYAYSAFPYYV